MKHSLSTTKCFLKMQGSCFSHTPFWRISFLPWVSTMKSIANYSHVLWLMKENGYTEDSVAFQEFTDRINEIRQMKTQAVVTE